MWRGLMDSTNRRFYTIYSETCAQMDVPRSITAAPVLAVICSILLVTAGVGATTATAQEVPSLPGVYYGEVTLADGEVDQQIRIEAVADGEVQDTIIADADGSFGGPNADDAKMEVQEPESGQVEFHIGGEPVTVQSADGETIDSTSLPFESGTQEIVLEATSEDLAPNATVAITETNSPVEAGNDLTVDVAIRNDGPTAITESVELQDFDGNVVANESVDIPIDGTGEATLTWTTNETLDANGTITATLANGSATAAVEVNRIEPPVIDNPQTGGGGGGGIGSGDDPTATPDGTAVPTDEPADVDAEVSYTETRSIVSDEGFNLSQVRFASSASVVSITWEGTAPEGEITTTTLRPTANVTPAAPGRMLTRAEVTGPETLSNAPATIQLRVDPAELDTQGIETEALRIYRFSDGEWTVLSTRVVEDSDDEIRVQTVAPSLAVFAVSAVGEPEAAINVAPQTPTAGEEVTFDASGTTTPYGDVVGYEWTIDGESFTGETVTTTIDDPGDVTVEVVVENDAGLTATATESIQVTAPPTETTTPTASATTETGTPGFTTGTAVIALVVSLLVRWRQRR